MNLSDRDKWVGALGDSVRATHKRLIEFEGIDFIHSQRYVEEIAHPIREAMSYAKNIGAVKDFSMALTFGHPSIIIQCWFAGQQPIDGWVVDLDINAIVNQFDYFEAYERAMKILEPR